MPDAQTRPPRRFHFSLRGSFRTHLPWWDDGQLIATATDGRVEVGGVDYLAKRPLQSCPKANRTSRRIHPGRRWWPATAAAPSWDPSSYEALAQQFSMKRAGLEPAKVDNITGYYLWIIKATCAITRVNGLSLVRVYCRAPVAVAAGNPHTVFSRLRQLNLDTIT